VVDGDGVVVDAVPRSVMRRDNLPHLVVAVVVRDPAGRVYVHRRTDTKDVFPGMHDAMVAGTVAAGEAPETAARRELEEELGISGVDLVPLFTEWYADDRTRHLSHVWTVTWDGPVRHQPEEIAWGAWFTVEELERSLADPDWPFVPDGRALLRRYGVTALDAQAPM
jgi:8-oxo-dGTP pyrophosphatase MutT (NUDIX family)